MDNEQKEEIVQITPSKVTVKDLMFVVFVFLVTGIVGVIWSVWEANSDDILGIAFLALSGLWWLAKYILAPIAAYYFITVAAKQIIEYHATIVADRVGKVIREELAMIKLAQWVDSQK